MRDVRIHAAMSYDTAVVSTLVHIHMICFLICFLYVYTQHRTRTSQVTSFEKAPPS